MRRLNLTVLFEPKPKELAQEISVHYSIFQMLNCKSESLPGHTKTLWLSDDAWQTPKKWVLNVNSMLKVEDSSLENGHQSKYYLWYLLVVTTQQGKAP